jgi:transcriptional regulator with XRE-family HTH domain
VETLGKRIYHFRISRGLTRKELAKNICDESTLLRIEKDQQEPRLDIIYKFSKRLDIPVYYIIKPLDDNGMKYINRVKHLCREFVFYEDYLSLKYLIEQVDQMDNLFFIDTIDFKKFISWHKAILRHKLEGNLLQAKLELTHLLQKTPKLVCETDIGIGNSLGLIFLALHNKDAALGVLKKALFAIEQLPFIEDKTLSVRVGYNYALVLFYTQSYLEVINIGYKVLYHIESNHLCYMVGSLHHLLGIAHEELNILDEAENHMSKAAQFFLADSKTFYHVKALRALSEIQFKSGRTHEGLHTLRLVEKKVTDLSDPKNLPNLIEKMKDMYLSQGKL